MAVIWGICRIPDANLVMIVFAGLSSALLLDVKPFSRRLKKTVLLACYSAAVQLIFSVSDRLPFIQIITSAAVAYFVFSTLSDRHAGCIVMLTGFLGISAPPGFLSALGRSIDIFTGSIIVMAVTTLGNAGQAKEKAVQEVPAPGSSYHAGVLAAKLGIGTAVSEIFRLDQGSWIMLTILFINMSQSSDFSEKKLIFQRILAVPSGIITGGVLLDTFCRTDDRFIWLLPLLGATSFFIFYSSGNFFLFSLVFMITLTCFSDWLTGSGHSFNFRENFSCRTTATLIGAMIELFFFFPRNHKTEETP